uniref:Uncharacterized protein n=1 Tax=Arundo donax TaxID=35708 RepID=A0A0A9GC57_ARUDO
MTRFGLLPLALVRIFPRRVFFLLGFVATANRGKVEGAVMLTYTTTSPREKGSWS